jgi:hypothetical protein
MAEWSKAPASGAGPKGRGFEPLCCHTFLIINSWNNIHVSHQNVFLHQFALKAFLFLKWTPMMNMIMKMTTLSLVGSNLLTFPLNRHEQSFQVK